MQNSVLRSRMTLVYWCQPSSVGLFIQKSDFSIGLTCLYGSQPSLVAFAFKTTSLASELIVSMVPALICGFFMQNCDFWMRITGLYGCQTSPLYFCECKTACLDPEWRLSIGSSLHLWVCSFKRATLASDLLLSMDPSLHLWLLHAK